LDLDDFCVWYLFSGKNSVRDLAVQAISAYSNATTRTATEDVGVGDKGNKYDFFYDRDALVKYSVHAESTFPLSESIEEIQYLTGLDQLNIQSFLRIFTPSMSGKYFSSLSRESFQRSMKSLADSVGVQNDEDEDVGKKNLLNLLFDVFDVDGCDLTEIADLASALTIVCGGGQEENIAGENFISCIPYLSTILRPIQDEYTHFNSLFISDIMLLF
jgi:hypothetical protein